MSTFDAIFSNIAAPMLMEHFGDTATVIAADGTSEAQIIMGPIHTEMDEDQVRRRVREMTLSCSAVDRFDESTRIVLKNGEHWIVTDWVDVSASMARVKTALAAVVDRAGLIVEQLRHGLVVSRPVRVSNGQGGTTATLVPLGNYPAAVRVSTTQERELASQLNIEISHIAVVEPHVPIQRGDSVTWTDATGAHTANVLSIYPAMDQSRATCELEEIKRGV